MGLFWGNIGVKLPARTVAFVRASQFFFRASCIRFPTRCSLPFVSAANCQLRVLLLPLGLPYLTDTVAAFWWRTGSGTVTGFLSGCVGQYFFVFSVVVFI